LNEEEEVTEIINQLWRHEWDIWGEYCHPPKRIPYVISNYLDFISDELEMWYAYLEKIREGGTR